jgi:hypothetical protein
MPPYPHIPRHAAVNTTSTFRLHLDPGAQPIAQQPLTCSVCGLSTRHGAVVGEQSCHDGRRQDDRLLRQRLAVEARLQTMLGTLTMSPPFVKLGSRYMHRFHGAGCETGAAVNPATWLPARGPHVWSAMSRAGRHTTLPRLRVMRDHRKWGRAALPAVQCWAVDQQQRGRNVRAVGIRGGSEVRL